MEILMYSPLEQFEFIPITMVINKLPRTLAFEIARLFLVAPEFFHITIPVFTLSEELPIHDLFLQKYYLDYMNNMPSVVIEGLFVLPHEFVVQQFFINDFFFSKTAHIFWETFYHNITSPCLNNENKVINLVEKHPDFFDVYLTVENLFRFYCQTQNPDLELNVITVIENDIERPLTKEEILEINLTSTNNFFTFYWLNIYTSIFIVIIIYYFVFVICNTIINNTRYMNIWTFLIDLFLDFLFITYKPLVNKKLYHYFPIFVALFMLVFISNLTALIPFSFCLTSNLWFNLTLSLTVWVGVTVLAINVQGKDFFLSFVPANVPSALKPFLTIIEIISYIARAISLGVRIFANMLAGHSLIHILADLVENCVLSFGNVGLKLFGIFPAIILIFIVFIEFGICFLQALVFVILTSIYLNEAFGFNKH
jgi:ATP synthase subunit 6